MNSFKLHKFKVDKWRKLQDIEFDIANKITLISGHNGVGKSNLLSLIASTSGSKKYNTNSERNFHPEIYEYFIINQDEIDNGYICYSTYNVYDNNLKKINTFNKKLRLKDDTVDGRGIRIIPETFKYPLDSTATIASFKSKVRDEIGIGPDQRVPIPTYFLSLSRLHPLGESSPKVKGMKSNTNIITAQGNDKFKKWYNYVLEGSIVSNDLYKIDKLLSSSKTTKNSYYMDVKSTTPLTQSVGQDNLGNIISVLVDFYIISQQEDYAGGILCIDEIDVSLHPNAQLRLVDLLSKVSDELNLQIIISSHSLIIMKELLRLHKKNKHDYNLVYLKNASTPYVSKYLNYKALESDLFLEQHKYVEPNIKIYFEDDIGLKIFRLLEKAFHTLSAEKELEKYFENITIEHNIYPIKAFIGCDTLRQLLKCDKYFESVCIVLDGDARVKKDLRKNVDTARETKKYNNYLIDEVNKSEYSLYKNTDEGDPINLVYLPNYFPPEFFLYRIIYKYILLENEPEYIRFWRSLDHNPDTTMYTPQYLKTHLLIRDSDEITITRLKGANCSKLILDFCETSNILVDYYSRAENIQQLVSFWKDFSKSIEHLKRKNYQAFF